MTGRSLFFRRLNILVLDQSSVQVNTFPSGHASVVVAAALALTSASASVGVLMLIVAASITTATVLGRYHYTVGSVLGVLVGGLGWWIGFHVIGM